ncbi:MAG: histidine phosphatase family protein [Verrucomicrobia bacterium]|jgi:phosphohistidine phosphatase|nr:histidine phosphatase family protein [Verrucomicrobiota bacterium]
MKQITLVRHAKSSWHRGLRDIDRPLNARGERDAPLMAMHLRKQGFSPDILISSPATRAATTAEEIARGIGYDTNQILWEDTIYEAASSNLIELITNLEPQHKNVAIVGHNPGMTELANQLQHTAPIDNIPTCGVVTIELPIEHWTEVPQTLGTLQRFEAPKTLK